MTAAEKKQQEDDLRFEMALAAVTGDTAALNQAARRAAKLAHPDAGGTHEAAVQLNDQVANLRRDAELAQQTWFVAAVLDDSGSMRSRRNDVVTAFNRFVLSQQDVELGQVQLSVRPLHPEQNTDAATDFRPLSKQPQLLQKHLHCAGATPLFDGIGQAIYALEDKKAERAIVLIITDGWENGSRRWRRPADLRPLIEAKIDLGWQFIYVSLDRHSIYSAERLGLPPTSIAAFDSFAEMLKVVGEGLEALRLGKSETLLLTAPSTTGSKDRG